MSSVHLNGSAFLYEKKMRLSKFIQWAKQLHLINNRTSHQSYRVVVSHNNLIFIARDIVRLSTEYEDMGRAAGSGDGIE